METKLVKNISESILEQAAATIQNGGLVAFPTETVYGLGADGLNGAAVQKIYKAKGRPSDNPLILHIADLNMLHDIVKTVPETAKILMNAFWPGPLTLVFPKTERVPEETSGGLGTVAVRFPAHILAQELILKSGTPIAAPSANISGRPSPTRAEHVFEDLNGKIPWILDGGACEIGVESTVVDVTGEAPVILRPGKITIEQISALFADAAYDRHLIAEKGEVVMPKSPGMKYKHYAPKGQIEILVGTTEQMQAYIDARTDDKTAVMTFDRFPLKHPAVYSLGNMACPNEGCRLLFDYLRQFDALGIRHIYAPMPDKSGIGFALYNRLLKAAGGRVVFL